MVMFSELEGLLHGSLSSEETQRNRCTEKLYELSTTCGYTVELAKYMLDTTRDITKLPLQRLAGVLLKQCIQQSWENPEGVTTMHGISMHQIDERDKVVLRQELPKALGTVKDVQLQTGMAMVISSIAAIDWPENWPQLWPSLSQLLSSEETSQVDIGVLCVELLLESINNQYVVEMIPELFPKLEHIYSNTRHIKVATRSKVLTIVQTCLSLASLLAQAGNDTAMEIVSARITSWVGAMKNTLMNDEPALLTEVIRVMSVFIEEWPAEMEVLMSSILPQIWSLLGRIYPAYEQVAIRGRSAACQDGEAIMEEYCNLLLQVFDFIKSVLHFAGKGSRRLMYENLSEIAYTLIGYAQISVQQIERWECDPSQYVQDEDIERMEYNLRNVGAIGLFSEFEGKFGAKVLPVLSTAALRRLHEARSEEWQIQEAVLLVIGGLGSFIADAVESKGDIFVQKIFSFMPDFMNVLHRIISTVGLNIFLRARALWCASQYANHMSKEQLDLFIHVTIEGLDKLAVLPTRLLACRSIECFATCVNGKDALQPIVSKILGKLLLLLEDAPEDAFYFVLECTVSVLKLDENAASTICSNLMEVLCSRWIIYANIPLISNSIQEVFQTLAQYPLCIEQLQQHMAEPIATALKDSNELSGILEASMELIILLFPRAGITLTHQFFTTILDPLIALLMVSDDASVLQIGAGCLKVFVRYGATELMNWRCPRSGQTGIDCTMTIASKLLQPNLPDSAANQVGELISEITIRVPLSNTIVQSMIRAVVVRLDTAKLSSLIQSLCLVFARLVHSNGSVIVDVLDSLPSEKTHGSMLQFAMSTWLFWQPSFYGLYNNKVSLMALLRLYHMQDARLSQLIVKGDIIEPISTGRSTRMRTRSQKRAPEQYEEIAFNKRLLTVLVRSLSFLHEDEEDEWISSGESSCEETVQYLSNGMETGAFADTDSDAEDIEAKADPLYNCDVKSHIIQLFIAVQKDHENFSDFWRELKDADQALLQRNLPVAQ